MNSRVKGPEVIVAGTLLITTIIVIISSMPVLTQQDNFCLVESPIEEQESIDARIERSELEFDETIENENTVGNYYDKAATDQFNENGELIRRNYYITSSAKEIIDRKIENNELKYETNDPMQRDYYYRVAVDIYRSNGIPSSREYYDINGGLFAVSHYDGNGERICTAYYDCNGEKIIPASFPCFGVYPG